MLNAHLLHENVDLTLLNKLHGPMHCTYLIHLFHNSTDHVMNSRVSGQCSHAIPVMNYIALIQSSYCQVYCISEYILFQVSGLLFKMLVILESNKGRQTRLNCQCNFGVYSKVVLLSCSTEAFSNRSIKLLPLTSLPELKLIDI